MERARAILSAFAWPLYFAFAGALYASSFAPGSRYQPLETFAFLTGAAGVYLTTVQSPLNFPVGIVNSTAFTFVFLKARLFGDTGLSALYVLLGFQGWYLWLRGGVGQTELPVTRSRPIEIALIVLLGALATAGLYFYFVRIQGSLPFWDALTTSFSLVAQVLLNRKKIENWIFWIFVDIVYVPLYWVKNLHLTAGLYVIFLCLATSGWFAWRRSLRA